MEHFPPPGNLNSLNPEAKKHSLQIFKAIIDRSLNEHRPAAAGGFRVRLQHPDGYKIRIFRPRPESNMFNFAERHPDSDVGRAYQKMYQENRGHMDDSRQALQLNIGQITLMRPDGVWFSYRHRVEDGNGAVRRRDSTQDEREMVGKSSVLPPKMGDDSTLKSSLQRMIARDEVEFVGLELERQLGLNDFFVPPSELENLDEIVGQSAPPQA